MLSPLSPTPSGVAGASASAGSDQTTSDASYDGLGLSTPGWSCEQFGTAGFSVRTAEEDYQVMLSQIGTNEVQTSEVPLPCCGLGEWSDYPVTFDAALPSWPCGQFGTGDFQFETSSQGCELLPSRVESGEVQFSELPTSVEGFAESRYGYPELGWQRPPAWPRQKVSEQYFGLVRTPSPNSFSIAEQEVSDPHGNKSSNELISRSDHDGLSAFAVPNMTEFFAPDNSQVYLEPLPTVLDEWITPPTDVPDVADLSSTSFEWSDSQHQLLSPASSHTVLEESHQYGGERCACCNASPYYSQAPHSSQSKSVLLPSCRHWVCYSCITRRYDIKDEYDSCMTCPFCDSLIGHLDVADALQLILPLIVEDLLSDTRKFPVQYFSNQSIMVDKQDAAIVMRDVYQLVAREHGPETRLGSRGLPVRPLYLSIDRYLQGQPTNNVTTSEQLRTALLNCVETVAIDELQRYHGSAWIKRQVGYRRRSGPRRYGWREMKAAFERNGAYGTEMSFVMQAWTSIVAWVVGVLTLRWERRLDFLLGSRSM